MTRALLGVARLGQPGGTRRVFLTTGLHKIENTICMMSIAYLRHGSRKIGLHVHDLLKVRLWFRYIPPRVGSLGETPTLTQAMALL